MEIRACECYADKTTIVQSWSCCLYHANSTSTDTQNEKDVFRRIHLSNKFARYCIAPIWVNKCTLTWTKHYWFTSINVCTQIIDNLLIHTTWDQKLSHRISLEVTKTHGFWISMKSKLRDSFIAPPTFFLIPDLINTNGHAMSRTRRAELHPSAILSLAKGWERGLGVRSLSATNRASA